MIESCFFKQTPLNVAYHRLHTLTLTKFDLNLPWTLICFVHLAQSLRLERAKPCDPLDDWTRRLVSFQGLQFAQLLIVVFRTCEMLQRLLLIFYVCTATSLASKVFGWFGADLTCVCFFSKFWDRSWLMWVGCAIYVSRSKTYQRPLASFLECHASATQPWFLGPSMVVCLCCCVECPSFYKCSSVTDSFPGIQCGGGLEITTWLALQRCRQRLRPCSAAFWCWWLWWPAQTVWSRHSARFFQLLELFALCSFSTCFQMLFYII